RESSSYPSALLTYDLTSNTFPNIGGCLWVSRQSYGADQQHRRGSHPVVRWFRERQFCDCGLHARSVAYVVNDFRVSSTNSVGTTFTVSDLGTAFHIAGSAGNDTLVVQGLTLTSEQRAETFATNSIETITDPSGTYYAPPGDAGTECD